MGLGFGSPENLLSFIKGKKVLDIGAGLAGFAKDAIKALGADTSTNIISLDAMYAQGANDFDAKLSDSNSVFPKDVVSVVSAQMVSANWGNQKRTQHCGNN